MRNLRLEDLIRSAPDQPQLQAVRHDGRARRVIRRRHLHRLSRQGREPRRAVCAHRQRSRRRRPRQRPIARRRRAQHAGRWAGPAYPVVLVTGDNVAVKQVARNRDGCEDGRRSSARSIRAPRSCGRWPFVHRAVEPQSRDGRLPARSQSKPVRERAYTVQVQLRDVMIPEVAEVLPGMTRPAPDTVAFETDGRCRRLTR